MGDQLQSWNKTSNLIHAGILLVIFFVCYKYTFNPLLDLGGDNFSYLALAQNILDGNGYSSPISPDSPPASHFPPGYSVFLAAGKLISFDNLTFLKTLNGLCLLGSAWLLMLMIRGITNNPVFSFAVTALIFLNSGLMQFSSIIMSEMSYLFYSCLAFFGVYKLKGEKRFWRSPYFYLIVFSVSFAYYTRSIGVTLLGAIFLHYAFQKRFKLAGSVVGGFLIIYLPWIIRNSYYGIKGRYLGTVMTVNPWRPEEGSIQTVGEFLEKMVENFDETVIRGFTEVIFPFIQFKIKDETTTAVLIGGILIFILVMFGAVMMKEYKFLWLFYVLGNIFIFMIWHGGNGARYVWPLSPFVSFCFFWGILELTRILKIGSTGFRSKAPYAFLLLFFLFKAPLTTLNARSKGDYPPAFQNYFNIAREVGKLNKPELMVACRKPYMFNYFSRTYTMYYKYSLDAKEVIDHLNENGADLVVIDALGYSSTPRYLVPAVKSNPEKFPIAMELKNPNTYLVRFLPEVGYDGEMKNNKRDGFGTYVWENGNKFEGNWSNNLRNGSGKLTTKEGFVYEGVWSDDKLNGEVNIYDQNGNLIKSVTYQDNQEVN